MTSFWKKNNTLFFFCIEINAKNELSNERKVINETLELTAKKLKRLNQELRKLKDDLDAQIKAKDKLSNSMKVINETLKGCRAKQGSNITNTGFTTVQFILFGVGLLLLGLCIGYFLKRFMTDMYRKDDDINLENTQDEEISEADDANESNNDEIITKQNEEHNA